MTDMICYQMAETGTEQLNVRVPVGLSKRLERLALKFRKRSKATVAAEIVEQYAEFYEQLEQARLDVLDSQRQRALSLPDTVEPEKNTYARPLVRVKTEDKPPKEQSEKRRA